MVYLLIPATKCRQAYAFKYAPTLKTDSVLEKKCITLNIPLILQYNVTYH